MAKEAKRERRRMRRTIRKTLGTLFLISAIIVAAIPAEGLQAGARAAGDPVTVDIRNCNIPYIENADETIYTTGDGQYQFAYVSPKNASTNNKVAVILGYNGGYLTGGALTIPDSVDAYLKYSDSMGTSSGYAAVGKSGNFLFYAMDVPVLDSNGEIVYEYVTRVDTSGNPVLDDEGNQIIDEVMKTERQFNPCYYEDRANWQDLDVEDFFYQNGTDGNGDPVYAKTLLSEVQRIQGAEVWYIGNQYLETGSTEGTWKIAGDVTDPSQGIFAGQGNIKSLTVGEKLSGIGNYAFYGCSGMNSITLGNGLDTIGNYAFANCINMTTVNVDLYSRVDIIGDHAFYNCQALDKFSVPVSVTAIGDAAFGECYAMTHLELCGSGANVSLTKIGADVFKGCANLESLTFPRTFTNEGNALDVSMFKGCTALKYISTSNNIIEFVDSTGYTFAQFKEEMLDEFYFEGLADSPVHTMCTANNFAFSHLDKDLYEITVTDPTNPSIKAVYRVNSSNQLVYTKIDDAMTDVELPKTIGPYKIVEIDSGTFQNNYHLEKITIPSSITTINEDAFRGCYKLEDVIFSEPVNVSYIGANAFKTQDVTIRDANGDLPTLSDEPVLNFTGTISYNSAPFEYAMSADSNINVGSQKRTYITFYSGWPTNLAVQYNPDTDKNELIDYPTFKDIKTGTKYTTGNYAYMTEDYMEAAEIAVSNYGSNQDIMTDYEWDIINAALDIVLPEGIESIQSGLFVSNEADEEEVEKTITAYSLNEVAGAVYDEAGNKVAGGAFEGCTNLEAVYLMGATTSIGDYAFENCEKLSVVSVPATVDTMGLRPFTGCNELANVDFQESPYFTCENSVIYQLDGSGNKQKIVEFLNGRPTGVIDPAELAGVTEIAEEAFMNTKVSSVDFKQSSIEDIPEKAFASTGSLFSVYLPDTCKSISKDAFTDSSIQYLEVPGSVTYIDSDAFNGTTNKPGLTFYCEEGSNAHLYAEKNNIKTTAKEVIVYYTVTFWDWDATLLDTQTVEAGTDAVAPEVPGREDYIHTGWVPDYHAVQSDLQVTAQYEAEDPDAKKFTVTFLDHDDTVLKTTLVLPGADAEPPFDPVREGYTFVGWRPAVTNIQENTTIYAQYEKNDSSESQLTVRFIDHDDTVIYTQKVTYGEDAIAPQNPSREGYTFVGWRPAITGITSDLDTYAQYEKHDSSESQLTVRFIDHDDTVIYTQKVAYGEDAITPQNPTREGYVFTGWRPAITGITKDLDTYAQYEKVDTSTPGDGGTGDDNGGTGDNNAGTGDNNAGTGDDNTGNGDDNTGNGNDNAGTGNNNPPQTTTKMYTLTVRNGSGSGSYVAGSQPIIIANDPAANQEFDYWTIDPAGTKIASKVLTATVVTMPEGDVTVTAHYKTKTSTSTSTGSGNSSSNNTNNRPNNTQGSITPGGTTVVIDKNGLSNTGVVSATVNGSSDNFTIKITESDAAAEAAVKALMAEYGNDFDDIKYFPMDISLYDSAGKKEITDTTGLSIKITIPLPDSLIAYAGNNKVASVENGRLDTLGARFTTISGVPCVTFTAEHFSPYVIYVDTENLTAGVVSDDTPKTGDGIHPKWFLSIGLASISVILFMKKDRRTMQKVKVRA